MAEGREPTLVVDGRLDERLVERALEAADASPAGEQMQEALEATFELAELDPEGTLKALEGLRARPLALERLEACLAMNPERATFALGAAMQLVYAELSSPDPDVRSRRAEILRWLEGTW